MNSELKLKERFDFKMKIKFTTGTISKLKSRIIRVIERKPNLFELDEIFQTPIGDQKLSK